MSGLREDYLSAANLDRKVREHLELIAPYNRRELRCELQRAALLVVDMQRFFLEPGGPLYTANGRAVVPRVRALIEGFRERGRPVFYAAQMNRGAEMDRGAVLRRWWPTVPLEGSREVEIVDELAPAPGEKLIPKRRYSAFHATDLELTLRSLGVTELVVTGIFTNVCVEAAVRDAFMSDFLPFVPADCCAALNETLQLGSLRTMALWLARVTTVAELLA